MKPIQKLVIASRRRSNPTFFRWIALSTTAPRNDDSRKLGLMALISIMIGFSAAHIFSPAQAQNPETSVKTTNDTITFIVNGVEKARIDKNGLFVDSDITYSGTISDTGTHHE